MESWVEYSNDTEFPIQNLPYGVFSTEDDPTHRIGVAIGDYVLDLKQLAIAGLFDESTLTNKGAPFHESTLNGFMALGKKAWKEIRAILINLLSKDTATLRDNNDLRQKALIAQSSVKMHLPAKIGDYTDFYASKNHAYNVGVMFRGPDNALQPNWTWLPVGYHGRASSVVVSGTPLHRPCGQLVGPDGQPPATLGASKTLDFELELGYFLGPGNELGKPISIDSAKDRIFGVVLLNDWSARDIQRWEYVPLGPFGAKNFGTTISPWIVTYDALEPFFIQGPEQTPAPLDYLKESSAGSLDLKLETYMKPQESAEPTRILTSNAKYLYWSPQQMLTHHTVTGCNMNPGDLIGSGTISGTDESEYGSLLELCWKGTKTLKLNDGVERKFIQDYDTITMKGYAQGDNYRIGFGECSGQILPAITRE